ncbi:MAG TPA: hypothetical protein VN541_05405, partial [Tepidisphaeraceae bacterium]|nr:hypothetical protein [Tepidisphaeraceae bacterium]
MKEWRIIIFLAFSAAAASGDVVHLRDGSTLEGQVRRTADGYQITTLDGRTAQVATGDVKSIELKRAATESPDQQYDAFARFLAGTSDPKKAVQRCKIFIAENPGTPTARKAAHDLTLW